MFSKDSTASYATPTTTSTPTATSTPTTTYDTTVESAKITNVPSIISTDLKITGDLKSSGDIQLDGTIEGDINSRLLTVGEQAKVNGSIVADTVRISGTVQGQVKAKSVHLDKSARVTGDITHATLTMEAGAYLEGQVRRLQAANAGDIAKVAPLRPSAATTAREASSAGAERAVAKSPGSKKPASRA